MKKVFALLAVAAAVCTVSCKKGDDPTPAAKPTEATITAADVTVEEGATVQVNATTNSSAAISFTADNSGVYTIANGVITGVKAGEGSLKLSVAAVEGKFTAAEKTIKVTVTAKSVVPPTPSVASIEIDGDFADWAALEKGTFSQFFGDEDSTHPALTLCKVYATDEKIYVYVEYDPDQIDPVLDIDHVPFHCYINTDGLTSTGGFADQFSDAATDVMTEGFLYPDAVLGSYDPDAFAWVGPVNGEGWTDMWEDLGIEALCEGAGVEGKYEFSIDCAVLAGAGFPVADEFSIGFDIQKNWDSVGILPSVAPDEENPSGIMPSLAVKKNK